MHKASAYAGVWRSVEIHSLAFASKEVVSENQTRALQASMGQAGQLYICARSSLRTPPLDICA